MTIRPAILVTMPESTYRRMRLDELRDRLEALGDVTYCLPPSNVGTAEAIEDVWCSADAAVTGWGSLPPSSETVSRLPRLRIVCHTAGSVRMLPRALIERGVVVTSARAGIARTVAEYCLHHTIMLLRRGCSASDLVGDREDKRPSSETLYEKSVGLIGFGEVGSRFRDLLAPFACEVLVCDPYLTSERAAASRVRHAGLQDLMAMCRVVSLHAPDIPQTRGMIGGRELSWLQDGAVFINSARGRLVDTAALTAECASGRMSAVLDVTHPEPLPDDHPLRSMANVVLTPHVAGPTDDELPRMSDMAVTDLERFLRGEPPLHAISLRDYDVMSF